MLVTAPSPDDRPQAAADTCFPESPPSAGRFSGVRRRPTPSQSKRSEDGTSAVTHNTRAGPPFWPLALGPTALRQSLHWTFKLVHAACRASIFVWICFSRLSKRRPRLGG